MSLAPFVASPMEVVRRMLEIAKVGPDDTLYDLGCGDARMLITAVLEFKAKKAVGYELRSDLFQTCLKNIAEKNLGSRITVVNGDLMNADISEATVITLYLTSTGNDKLRPKFEKEAKPGTRIVSHDFSINRWRPEKVEKFDGHTIYLYVIPDSISKAAEESKIVRDFWHIWR
ncbi:MAG: rRNA adenine N-6-methyltransferase family protein [Candidatus Bathyarchaeia archaeon]